MPTGRVLMVDPIGFRANAETAEDNAFQQSVAPDPGAGPLAETRAAEEFRWFRAALEERGIDVVLFAFRDGARTPDAVFPNNWFTTHPDGTAILYPMRAASRRRERRAEILTFLQRHYREVVDLSPAQKNGHFLEGTGSLVIDERSRTVYASLSSRTDRHMVSDWADRFGYSPIVFTSRDESGREVYHTNVVMSVGSEFAIVCVEAIVGDVERSRVVNALKESGREVIGISLDQMRSFCANVLEMESAEGRRQVVMSERAWSAFTPDQRIMLGEHAEILHSSLGTIETLGGGSARCMLAELY